MITHQEFDLEIPSGRIHAQRFGSPDAPLALCIPGLTANQKAFDYLGERLGGDRLQLVAYDKRGRGFSSITGPGTYGWPNHAKDVFAIADALGADRFSVIGHSLGAAIAMQAAAIQPPRLERLVLIDLAGVPDPRTLPPIAASAARLGVAQPSVEAYIDAVKALGTITPWSEYWQRYYEYELEPVEGGVRARSNREAVLEDLQYVQAHRPDELWPHLTMPVLLVRATRELLPGAGWLVTAEDAARFPREVAGGQVVEVDANHYTVATSDATVAAIRAFFG